MVEQLISQLKRKNTNLIPNIRINTNNMIIQKGNIQKINMTIQKIIITIIQLIIRTSRMKTHKIDQVDIIKHKSMSRKVDKYIHIRKMVKIKKHYKTYPKPD
jgi:hypothetical protein